MRAKQYGHLADALTSMERSDIPSSSFAAVYTDAQGKKQRKLPIHDAVHVRNALARFSSTDLPAELRTSARAKIIAAAKRFGVEVSP